MPHLFSNCPLRINNRCLLITHHANKKIITATDELLDLLDYSMSDLVGDSIQQHVQITFNSIPTCKIQHKNGSSLQFQVCVHKDPFIKDNLDYWLVKPLEESIVGGNTNTSVMRLSPYGTIEQIQSSEWLKQSSSELLGRPIMAFVYHDDVEPLCCSLSKMCSIHHSDTQIQSLCIRWSNLPYVFQHTADNSLEYDWISFTIMSNNQEIIRPICTLQPLQLKFDEDDSEECQELILHVPLLHQLITFCKLLFNEFLLFTQEGKLYLTEFYNYVLSTAEQEYTSKL